jgi:hypothetical protein
MWNKVAGALKSVALTLGGKFIAPITMSTVEVEIFVLPAFGVHPKTPEITRNKSVASLITVQHTTQ